MKDHNHESKFLSHFPHQNIFYSVNFQQLTILENLQFKKEITFQSIAKTVYLLMPNNGDILFLGTRM